MRHPGALSSKSRQTLRSDSSSNFLSRRMSHLALIAQPVPMSVFLRYSKKGALTFSVLVLMVLPIKGFQLAKM